MTSEVGVRKTEFYGFSLEIDQTLHFRQKPMKYAILMGFLAMEGDIYINIRGSFKYRICQYNFFWIRCKNKYHEVETSPIYTDSFNPLQLLF